MMNMMMNSAGNGTDLDSLPWKINLDRALINCVIKKIHHLGKMKRMIAIKELTELVETFNRGIDPIIQTIGLPFENDLRSIKNVLNRDIDAVIRTMNFVITPTPTKNLQEDTL